MSDNEEFSSQVIEEEDLILDDMFSGSEENDDEPVDLPTSQRDRATDTLRSRIAGPSAYKAGLGSVDRDQVNRIIYEASKGSPFFEHEQKKDKAVTKRIESMLERYEEIRHVDLSFETKVVDNMIRDMESQRDLTKCFCHVDMDAFYASVEELEQPELKQVPMAVGSMSMLCTSNYVARKYGVRSAMPGYIALKLCPSLKIIPLHFPKYRAASAKVREVFAKYDPDFVPMSLDEYLAKTEMTPSQVVQQIRDEITQETSLTASAGIAPNRMLAKVCSDIKKPNGQYHLPNSREMVMGFVQKLLLRKIPGVGRVTERVLEALGVKTCGDIYDQRNILYKLLSPISFKFMLRSYLGIGSTKLHVESARKSIGVERTFPEINTRVQLFQKAEELAELLAKDLANANLKGKTVGIKLKLTSFESRTRARTLPSYVSNAADIARVAKELIAKEMPVSLRLMGVRLTSLQPVGHDDEGVKKVSEHMYE
ncbi:hypothetical protein DFQ28_009737 [Apophysomyces sp. BC1034]|nr:hypothetical protein DFQ28_009737 [Apophysomyces sp. BC1034]